MGARHLRNSNNAAKKQKFIKKKHTAVTFDQQQRDNYLKGMFGAKKRRKQHHLKKVEQQTKVAKHQQRAQIRQNRKKQIEKLKTLLKIQDQKNQPNNLYSSKLNEQNKSIHKDGKHVQIVKQDNLIVKTVFY